MKPVKRIAALLMALMIFSLCACSSAGKNSGGQRTEPSIGTYYTSYDYAAEEAMVADYDTAYGFSGVQNTAMAAAAAKSSGSESDTPAEDPEKIIYSADVTVETTSFDETIGMVSGLVEEFGGWIESSSVSGSNYYQKSRGTASTRDASYTLRIPSGRFQELMDSLSGLGNIPYSHIYTENVTTQYYDAQAHLKAYETQENRLLEMMELAESVEDVITIEDRLTELRYQIESLQSRLNNWDRRVSYSTISLSIKEVQVYTPEEKVNPTFGEEILEAIRYGLKNAGEFLKNLLILILEVLPTLIILVPIVWLIVCLLLKLIRKIRSKAKVRREARRAEKNARKQDEAAAKAEKSGKDE